MYAIVAYWFCSYVVSCHAWHMSYVIFCCIWLHWLLKYSRCSYVATQLSRLVNIWLLAKCKQPVHLLCGKRQFSAGRGWVFCALHFYRPGSRVLVPCPVPKSGKAVKCMLVSKIVEHTLPNLAVCLAHQTPQYSFLCRLVRWFCSWPTPAKKPLAIAMKAFNKVAWNWTVDGNVQQKLANFGNSFFHLRVIPINPKEITSDELDNGLGELNVYALSTFASHSLYGKTFLPKPFVIQVNQSKYCEGVGGSDAHISPPCFCSCLDSEIEELVGQVVDALCREAVEDLDIFCYHAPSKAPTHIVHEDSLWPHKGPVCRMNSWHL